ncbi:MAG: isoleucine--tRNA ligase, partial [Proteobacteria bacterium]|nr:isoleucine--tRNA ligase [Pseudomonadota bacterium]
RPKGVFDDADSVHLRQFPDISSEWKNDALAADWIEIRKIRKSVLEAIEPKRASKELGSSLEAKPVIAAMPLLERRDMAELCITAPFEYRKGAAAGIAIEKAPGSKCTRCWKVLPEVGKDKDHPELCVRCADAVDHLEKTRKAA